MPLLFVYGSLKRGFRLHRHLQPGRFLGVAHTEPGYALYRLGWYPGLVAEPGSSIVTGELHEIPEALLPILDEVEGAPDLFQQAQLEVTCPEHSPGILLALTYLYQQPVTPGQRLTTHTWHET